MGTEMEGDPQILYSIFGIGDVKFRHLGYTILSAIVMIDLFLDPDIVGTYLECTQGIAAQLILDLIMKIVDPDLVGKARDSRDLILSLEFRYGSGMDMMAREAPARI